MSVDQRLRRGLAQQPEPDVFLPALGAIRRASRARQVRSRTAFGAALLGVAAAAVVVVQASGDGIVAPESPQPGNSATTTPTQEPTGLIETPLNGRWRTDAVSPDRIRTTLTEAGLGQHADVVLAELPSRNIVLMLRVSGSAWEMSVRGEGFTSLVLDQEYGRVTGDRVSISPIRKFAEGATTHTWDITGKTLRLTFQETTEPDSSGAPGEAWQRALYTSAPFRLVE